MPFAVHVEEDALLVDLKGTLTIRHAQQMGQSIVTNLVHRAKVKVEAGALEDIDTSILQLLVSLQKSAASFVVQSASEAFLNALDRCALRRELLAGSKEFV